MSYEEVFNHNELGIEIHPTQIERWNELLSLLSEEQLAHFEQRRKSFIEAWENEPDYVYRGYGLRDLKFICEDEYGVIFCEYCFENGEITPIGPMETKYGCNETIVPANYFGNDEPGKGLVCDACFSEGFKTAEEKEQYDRAVREELESLLDGLVDWGKLPSSEACAS